MRFWERLHSTALEEMDAAFEAWRATRYLDPVLRDKFLAYFLAAHATANERPVMPGEQP
jgi:hypothetical protein